MYQSPGVIVPSSYSSPEELAADLKRRNEEAGFTPFSPEPDYLAHYGVKGMHWGTHHDKAAQGVADQIAKVRKSRGTKHDVAKETTKKAFERKTASVGGIHKLSDEDLKKMIERLGNEKKYTDILNEDAARRKAHRDTVLKALGEVGKILIPIVVSAAAGAAAAKAGGAYRTNTINPRVIEGVAKVLGK